jgi:drug/metabolite transporter (DMT)-like permease
VTHGILLLVLLSAVAHATWNLLAKRAGGGIAFQWLFTTISIPIYAPLAILVAITTHAHVDGAAIVLIAGSALLHLIYFLLLGRGYRTGDLSLIYPLARGSGPLLSTIGAVVLIGERPTLIAVCGTLLIACGAFLLTGDPRALRKSGNGRAVAYAGLTGLFIAAYTLWDKEAVSRGGLAPILFYWAATLVMGVALTPAVTGRRKAARDTPPRGARNDERHPAPIANGAEARDMPLRGGLARERLPAATGPWQEVREVWRRHRLEVLGVAILSPLAYFLVLTALVTAPVSYVAPIRESGILIGAIMGLQLLAEGHARSRLTAAALMMSGVVALAIG